tara:strand:+ start:1540 stop:2286 length:747 start_codon:yes stop_codon:yes gene_type:complete
MENKTDKLVVIADELKTKCNELKEKLIKNSSQVKYAYNPLDYAWEPHQEYIRKYANLGAKTILMGMNPGHGMGNTGIPFGCPKKVKNYLNIKNLEVKKPKNMHPKRDVFGLECKKPEVSGSRIWGLVEEIYGAPKIAFRNIYVINHFPLWMFNEKGQNITPDKLRLGQAKDIFDACDNHLIGVTKILETKKIVAIGKYAEKMAKNSISTSDYNHIEVKVIPHPSPANPIANKDKGRIWREIVKEILTK